MYGAGRMYLGSSVVVVTESCGCPVQVWNINTYTVVHEFPEQNHWVRALVVHGKSLFSGSYKTVKVRGVVP